LPEAEEAEEAVRSAADTIADEAGADKAIPEAVAVPVLETPMSDGADTGEEETFLRRVEAEEEGSWVSPDETAEPSDKPADLESAEATGSVRAEDEPQEARRSEIRTLPG
jgi:hypothetical protein